MKCSDCRGTDIRKNGHGQQKQNYICVTCGRQFLEEYGHRGYSNEVKRLCLKMYVNGMGIRGISRVTGIAHTTILNWIKQSGSHLPDSYEPEEIPHVGELDELETNASQQRQESLDLDGGRPLSSGNSWVGCREPQH